jgi:hypothetical protein
MQNNDVWFQALFLQPPAICGVKLKPFSLGHEFILRYLGNPYIVGGEVSKVDLLAAILICSKTFEDCRSDLIYNPKPFRWALWSLWCRCCNLKREEAEFIQYVSDSFLVPEHFNKDSDHHGSFAAPWEMHAVHILCKEYRCSLNQAWDMPVNLARCYYDVWGESKGDNSIVPSNVDGDAGMNALQRLIAQQKADQEKDMQRLKAIKEGIKCQ